MSASDDLMELAERGLRDDADYMVAPEGELLDWLIAQLANWPTRVDPERTTNITFLMKSAAAALRARARAAS